MFTSYKKDHGNLTRQMEKKAKLSGPERREQIIRTAAEVFSRYGFQGTTLRQLARRAGISEATIYHHFSSKEALYDAILEKKISDSKHLFFPVEAVHAKKDRTVLTTIVGNFLQQQRLDNSFMRMLLFSALEGHELSQKFVHGPLQEFFDFFGGYLEKRMDEGAIRQIGGQVGARLLIGMAFYFTLLREIYLDPQSQQVNLDDLTEIIVDLFYEGIKSSSGKS
jgi:AcrR family transcriptional regulator